MTLEALCGRPPRTCPSTGLASAFLLAPAPEPEALRQAMFWLCLLPKQCFGLSLGHSKPAPCPRMLIPCLLLAVPFLCTATWAFQNGKLPYSRVLAGKCNPCLDSIWYGCSASCLFHTTRWSSIYQINWHLLFHATFMCYFCQFTCIILLNHLDQMLR